MVGRRALTRLGVNLGGKLYVNVCRHLLDQMHRSVVLFLGVEYLGPGSVGSYQPTLVAYLTAHLAVEGSGLKHDLVVFLVLLLYVAVAQYACLDLSVVVAYECLVAGINLDPVGILYGSGVACACLLFGHLGLEALYVYVHAVFAKDQLRQVERESVGVVESEGVGAAYQGLSLLAGLLHDGVEQRDTLVERTEECFFLLLDYLLNEIGLSRKFGICVAHLSYESVDEQIEQRLLAVEEGVDIAHGTAQDAADHITGLGVAGEL